MKSLWSIVLSGVCAIYYALASVTSASSTPGLTVRVSHDGLQYAADVATQILKERIRNLPLPTIRERKSLKIGNIDYRVSNVAVKSFTAPSVSTTTTPLLWNVRGKWLRRQRHYTGASEVSGCDDHAAKLERQR